MDRTGTSTFHPSVNQLSAMASGCVTRHQRPPPHRSPSFAFPLVTPPTFSRFPSLPLPPPPPFFLDKSMTLFPSKGKGEGIFSIYCKIYLTSRRKMLDYLRVDRFFFPLVIFLASFLHAIMRLIYREIRIMHRKDVITFSFFLKRKKTCTRRFIWPTYVYSPKI